MSGLTHRKDVEFLEGCNPALVERNADEFQRIHDVLVETDEPAERAERHTHWHSEEACATKRASPRHAS